MSLGLWFHCKGCGAEAGYFPDGHESSGYRLPAGAVVHAGVRPVQCPLFRRLESDEYWALHKDAPRIESPDTMEPILP